MAVNLETFRPRASCFLCFLYTLNTTSVIRMISASAPASEPAMMVVLEEEWSAWRGESDLVGPAGVDEGDVMLMKQGLRSSAHSFLFHV